MTMFNLICGVATCELHMSVPSFEFQSMCVMHTCCSWNMCCTWQVSQAVGSHNLFIVMVLFCRGAKCATVMLFYLFIRCSSERWEACDQDIERCNKRCIAQQCFFAGQTLFVFRQWQSFTMSQMVQVAFEKNMQTKRLQRSMCTYIYISMHCDKCILNLITTPCKETYLARHARKCTHTLYIYKNLHIYSHVLNITQ